MKMLKSLINLFFLYCVLMFCGTLRAQQQTIMHNGVPTTDFRHAPTPADDPDKPWTEVYRDTITRIGHTVEVRDSVLDPLRVVTNKFGNNWFVFATGGAHSFRGDYSNTAGFGGTVSPDWSVGIGKWFTPGLALKLEFIKSQSEGYTEFLTGHYGYGPIELNDQGVPYRRLKTRWWDISGALVFNITRLVKGYEGYNSPKRMNQFMMALGFGGVHHLGYKGSHGSDNEWSAHVELQYSRFFTPAKRFSLDFKIRGIFYQTNFDLEYGLYDGAAQKWDCNLGVDVGFTWYLGKKRGWGSGMTKIYQRDFREQNVLVYRERVDTVMQRCNAPQVLSFYVFYPNNYSGRDDAPNVEDAKVNAIEYLLGGIFTQKKFSDTAATSSAIGNGNKLTGFDYEDIPTENPSADFDLTCVQRGYEMSPTTPMSLSMEPDAMERFFANSGYYYAPIWDGLHHWHYRIDQATYKQQLLSGHNYYERETYGLNSHHGLNTLVENMGYEGKETLVSFADMYAAFNGNTGFIRDYADDSTVEMIRDILTKGIVTRIEAHGVATSQDNYTGSNAVQVGIERNKNLANNRANTVVKWLKGNPALGDIESIIFVGDSFTSGINKVSDPSTRGLNAKLNRCVKVKIEVIY